MKKIKIILAFCMVILCSCQKNECVVCESRDPHPETVTITVGFGLAGTSTRSFLDDMAEGWAWESEIHRIGFYVYSRGVLVLSVDATLEQIVAGHIDLHLPVGLYDREVAIYAVANAAEVYRPTSEAAMMSLKVSGNLNSLNVGLEALRQGSPTANGLMMSGKISCVPCEGGSVTIELKRTVAKIILELKISDDFYTTHNASGFVLDYIRVHNQSASTYLMEDMSPRAASSPYVGAQVGGVYEDGLYRFVVYTHEVDAGDKKAEIYIAGTCKIGGSTTTTSARIPLEPDNPSLIHRNTCYRIKGEIYGIGYTSISTRPEVVEWTALPGQDIVMGR